MKLSERLKRLEAKAPAEQPIFIVQFGTELNCLKYGDDKYYRLDGEKEDEFSERVLAIVKKNPHPNGFYIVGNIC
jgi:hypothetical protein